MAELKDFLIQYSNDVLSGDIIACEKHKWACLRFLNDVEREKHKQFPYVFDEQKALRFMKWMTKFKHTKGPLRGTYIMPHPIQIFNFSNIYGWVHYQTGYRRFNLAYWQVARKNAKSQSLSCVGSYEASALGEGMSEVYIGATKKEQADIIYNEMAAQIKQSEFKDKFEAKYGKIIHKKSDSIIKSLSKEDNKKGDGFNPQSGLIDEYHLHDTTEVYDVLLTGMGARSQPLIFIITTAGSDLNKPCYTVEYDYVTKILDPNIPIENDNYFVMINELDKGDDIRDEANWVKANPIAASHNEGIAYLRKMLKRALDVPSYMKTFLTKNMNIWVDAKDNGYMKMDKWHACGDDNAPSLEGRECYVGADLSKKIDLTSLSFVFKNMDGTFDVRSHSFLPEEALKERENTDRVPYSMWIEEGYLTDTPGDVVDYNFIEHYVEVYAAERGWKVKEICYDPYNATHFASNMQNKGFKTVEISQSMKVLSEPTSTFREYVLEGKIRHDNNPVLTWAMSNAVEKQDAQGNIMLDKKKSKDRIDPAAATIFAFVRAMVDEGPSINDHIASQDFTF
ncbi:terminase large subunit [Macrococcus equipercicus]|uniref:Terminase large subunit n=1 Tax=Macrococcus equipercicus TaxID=69967 RepID=A0ABQ6R7R0_9STAP|nr:terminase TerL endonuclease subunit [Macrococcus equipercicus]KAA1039126.1 terminase large subunit [Macrococcus equipercicus]